MKPLTGECNCENGKKEKVDVNKEDKNKVGIGCSPWQRGCVLDHLHGGKIMCPFSDFLAVATALLSRFGGCDGSSVDGGRGDQWRFASTGNLASGGEE